MKSETNVRQFRELLIHSKLFFFFFFFFSIYLTQTQEVCKQLFNRTHCSRNKTKNLEKIIPQFFVLTKK